MTLIRIVGTQAVIACLAGETVLQALQRSGNSPSFGCRRGGCAVCKINVIDGTFTYVRAIADSVLPPEERDADVCLTCRAVPETDLTVSLDYQDRRRNPLADLLHGLRGKGAGHYADERRL